MNTLLPFLMTILPAAAQSTDLASANPTGQSGNGPSWHSVLTADGRALAFKSGASDLVPNDNNGCEDVFMRDLGTGITTRISVASGGPEGNGPSHDPSLSADGRYVAYGSDASNLVAGDGNGAGDIFVSDWQSQITERISVNSSGGEGGGKSYYPSISADGRYVAFVSDAENLVAGDSNGVADIFVHDRQSKVTERVSVDQGGGQANGGSYYAFISADGRTVAFYSAADNLVSDDNNSSFDVFVYDRLTKKTELVSVNLGGGVGDGDSWVPALSSDGRIVVFSSVAGDLVPVDTNNCSDVFIRDRGTGFTERVSVSTLGKQGLSSSDMARMSANGRFVAYQSGAANLVPGDSNGTWDIFLRDLGSGTTTGISVNTSGAQGNDASRLPFLSADGRFVTFDSLATNLVPSDQDGDRDVFLRDRGQGSGTNRNTIILAGPITGQVGESLELTWFAAPPDSTFWLLWSLNLNGAMVGGHPLDLGASIHILETGLNSSTGGGGHISLPLPASAAGRTLHFEILAQDTNGTLADSNPISVQVD